ncbi:unnamed protein product [Vitrella brassicaformis CCMP3155]|uniref:Metallo-beta-lactamase domain-containing protein n=2 Tax=Vitrella brassicaformis TaxID=1169539 RepID=A0A0G4H4H2_VITBC|nr:unnamed protein product [Vitrella brassicaformis CCMP3155]|eukprot:CEM38552.1 unnamed protein product [Vitrella brassicaformis CCMP3155]
MEIFGLLAFVALDAADAFAFPSPAALAPSLRPLSLAAGPPFRSRLRRDGNARLSMGAAAPAASSVAGALSSTADGPYRLTWLEGNSWLWEVGGVRLLVDPVLEGALNFNIPSLYSGEKRSLPRTLDGVSSSLGVTDSLDAILITQGLEDHCHARTLNKLKSVLSSRPPRPSPLPIVTAPSALPTLESIFSDSTDLVSIVPLRPGESVPVYGDKGVRVDVTATSGALVGPPWQDRENGYLVTMPQGLKLYYEPHCDYIPELIKGVSADVVITPVTYQRIFGYAFVKGGQNAVSLIKQLGARVVAPMNNGELEAKGILTSLIKSEGGVEPFKALLAADHPNRYIVMDIQPGQPADIPIKELLQDRVAVETA